MSWDELAPEPKAAKAIKAPVRVMMFKSNRSDKCKSRMQILVETGILLDLGGKHFRFRVQVGRGALGHQLKVQQDDAGPFEPGNCGPPKQLGKRNFYQRIRLPAVDHFPDQSIAAVACEYTIEKASRSLIITLPAWAWHNWHKRQVVAAA